MIYAYRNDTSIGVTWGIRSRQVKNKYLPLSQVNPLKYNSKSDFLSTLIKQNPAPVGFTYVFDPRPTNFTFGTVYVLNIPISTSKNIKMIKQMAAQKGAVIVPGNMFDVKFSKPIIDEKFIVYPFNAGGSKLALFKYDPKTCREMLPKRNKKRNTSVKKGEIPVATIRSFRDFLVGLCRDEDLGVVVKFRGYAAKSRKHWMMETAAIAHTVKFFVPEEELYRNRRYIEYIKDFFDYIPRLMEKGDNPDKRFAKWVDSEHAAVTGSKPTTGEIEYEDDYEIPDTPDVLQISRILDLGGLGDDNDEEEDQDSASEV